MATDPSDGQISMNEKEKKELALSEVALIVLGVIGLFVVIWLAWIRD
jgi:cytoskeletal protein RodZ